MSRRSNPERIRAARVAAVRNRLAVTGMLPDRVEVLWAAWEAQAERDGLDPNATAYWTAVDAWITRMRPTAN